jgi:hypothetical protein
MPDETLDPVIDGFRFDEVSVVLARPAIVLLFGRPGLSTGLHDLAMKSPA